MSRKLAITGMGEYRFVTPVTIMIEREAPDGRFFAYWPEVEASGYGMTETEALAALKVNAMRRYEFLRSPDGPRPRDGACLRSIEQAMGVTL